MDDHAILNALRHSAGQDGLLDVAADSPNVGTTLAVRYPRDVLFDDRAFVEILGAAALTRPPAARRGS